ncbi:MAG TPA: hypothetical protein VI039_04230 [Solirubrobacterales bacterium]
MNAEVVTPPHRDNPDWYRVKYRLASTLTNDAHVHKTSYEPAAKEIDELLQACWQQMLDLETTWPWQRKDKELRKFIVEGVEPAALDLKALIELGLQKSKPGEALGWDLATVRKQLREGKPVPPLTIIEALLKAKKPGRSLLFDLACFFQLSGDSKRARQYADEAFATVPTAELARVRAQVAADPMLKVIPGVIAPTDQPAKGRSCRWPWQEAKAKEPAAPARPWI